MGMFSSPKLPPVPEGPNYADIDDAAAKDRQRQQAAGGVSRAATIFAGNKDSVGYGSASKLLGG